MQFSIIVPCCNCRATIDRVLRSIVNQQNTYPNLQDNTEVILVDDSETHDFLDIVAPYTQILPLRIISTNNGLHNPGNTRNFGMDAAKGDWLLFIDDDDELIDGALSTFARSIDAQFSPCHASYIQLFDENGPYDGTGSNFNVIWTHGKVYNRIYLNDCQLRFHPTICACEDSEFNYKVMAHMLHDGYYYASIPVKTYNHHYNPYSLTHSNQLYMAGHHFQQFVEANLMPWVDNGIGAGDTQKVFNMFKMFLTQIYFLYQYNNRICVKYDTAIVKRALSRTYIIYRTNLLDIINAVEDDYDTYMQQYTTAIGITGEKFVCPESFRTWIMNL